MLIFESDKQNCGGFFADSVEQDQTVQIPFRDIFRSRQLCNALFGSIFSTDG